MQMNFVNIIVYKLLHFQISIGELILQEAKMIAQDLIYESTYKSVLDTNWINQFKTSRGIEFKRFLGECANADIQSAVHFGTMIVKSFTLMRKVFYRALPDSTHTFENERGNGGKKAKETYRYLLVVMPLVEKNHVLPLENIRNQDVSKSIRSDTLRICQVSVDDDRFIQQISSIPQPGD